MEPKLKKCQSEGCSNEFKPLKSTQKFCSYVCTKNNQKSPKVKKTYLIPKFSKRRKVEQLQYSSDRLIFLQKKENRICPVTGKQTTEVHHKKGRIGSLYLDQRFWLAVSSEGHKFIHENDKWSRENGYLLSRLTI